MAVDITRLPPPPATNAGSVDISRLPPPPAAPTTTTISKKIEELPPPPSDYISEDKFEELGKKYGVSPAELRDLAPYYGVTAETTGGLPGAAKEAAKYTAGYAGRSLGLGIPQFIYKKLQDEPMRKALDELNAIGQEQRSLIETATEIAAPGGAIGQASKKAATRIVGAATTGAGVGAVNAPEGKELEGARTGAAIGAALGSGGELLARTLRGSASKVEAPIIAESGINLSKGAEEIATRNAASEKIVDDALFGKRTSLSQDEVNTILKEQLSPETLDKLMSPATAEGSALRRIVLEDFPEEAMTSGIERVASRQLAQDILETKAVSFAEELTGTRPSSYEEAIDAIDNAASRQGPAAIRDKYSVWNQTQQAEKYILETGARATSQPGFFGRTANFISDNQYVLRNLDDKYGTKFEPALSEASSNFNKSTHVLNKFANDRETIATGARKLGVDDSVVNTTRIYDAMNSGNIDSLSPAEQKVAQGFRAYFDSIRDFSNGLVKEKHSNIQPLAIPFLENYVPQQMRSIPETIGLLETRLDRVKQIASQQFGREIKDIGQLRPEEFARISNNKNTQELIEAVSLLNKGDTSTPIELSTRLKELMYSREGNIALESVARAALERKGGIPDFLLEKNMYKLADKYTSNTMRHLYMRAPLDKLRLQARNLRKLGADTEAEYVENIVRDVLGTRKGTAAEAMLQTRILATGKIDKLIEQVGKDSIRGGILTAAKTVPDMLESLTREIYPNVLGYYNLRAVVQNSTQSITKLAPELGSKYGYATVVRSAPYTFLNLPRLLRKAETLGTIPADFSRKGEKAIAEGIQRSALYNVPKDALDGMAKAGMFLYQKMEQFNRALTLGVGEMMAHDLTSNNMWTKLSRDSLVNKFPRTVQEAVARSGNNTEEVANIISRHLNDTTQYNYNRVSLAEFGRTMGPFFSTFSKWPTATAGDMIYEFRSKGGLKGLARNAEKYVAPLLLLESINYVMEGKDKELSDIQKKIVGSRGLGQAAPIGAVGAIATGEIFTPPAVDALMQALVMPAIKGDTGKLKKGVASAAQNFTPGAGLVRLLTDDLVTYATGTRPEGSDFFERTQEGARIIERKLK